MLEPNIVGWGPVPGLNGDEVQSAEYWYDGCFVGFTLDAQLTLNLTLRQAGLIYSLLFESITSLQANPDVVPYEDGSVVITQMYCSVVGMRGGSRVRTYLLAADGLTLSFTSTTLTLTVQRS